MRNTDPEPTPALTPEPGTDRRDNRPKGRPKTHAQTAQHYAAMAQIARWEREDDEEKS